MSELFRRALLFTWLLPAALAGCASPSPPPPESEVLRSAEGPAEATCEGTNCRLERLVKEYEASAAGPQAAAEWLTLSSASFRVIHRTSAAAAAQLAQRAEALRDRQLRYWGVRAAPAWSPQCELILYDSFQDLRLLTRGTTSYGSAQARAAKLQASALLSRKINLVRRDRHLLQDTLPHEISHIILQELLGNRQLPLWANEGMAVLWESKAKIQRLLSALQPHLGRGDFFALEVLFAAARYPEQPEQKRLFYAQSASLIYFLLGIDRSPAKLLAFLRQISPPSYARQAHAAARAFEAALLQHYGIEGLAELTQRWRLRLDARLQRDR